MDRWRSAPAVPKQIFLYPLHRRWRQQLCGAEDGALFQEAP
jgi:hypothetical protein